MCKTRQNPAQTIIGRLSGRLLTDPDQPQPDNPIKPAPHTSTRGEKPAKTEPQTTRKRSRQPTPNKPTRPHICPLFETNPDIVRGIGWPKNNNPIGAKQTTMGQSPTDQTTGAKQPAQMYPAGQSNDPQTGQTIKPNPTPAKLKQPRKRGTL